MTTTEPRVVSGTPMVYLDVDRAIAYTGGAAATRGLLQMVEQSLGHDVDAIYRYLEAGDAVAAGRALHVIKGFAPIFCVEALTENVAILETLGQAGEIGALRPAYVELAPKLLALHSEIQAYLAVLPQPT
jgi:hypothetical protein